MRAVLHVDDAASQLLWVSESKDRYAGIWICPIVWMCLTHP